MADENNTNFDYHPNGSDSGDKGSPKESITWTAAEFIEHERGNSWYFALILITAVLAAGTYLITKDYFAIGIIVVLGIIIGVTAGKKPRNISYEVNNRGIVIGNKLYAYSMFKSFSVAQEGQMNSVNFQPIKRYIPIVSAYFSPQDEDAIVDTIGEHLPLEEHKLDSVDRLARRLRF